MAEIPVEKKNGTPWWVWLLLGLLLLGLLWWLLSDDDEVEAVDTAAPVAVETDTGSVSDDTAMVGATAAGAAAGTAVGATAGGPITDLATIIGATDDSLVGREVRLTGVTAGAVPEDAGFYVTGAGGERVWVVLEEVRTPNTPIEGRVDVDQGDTVDIVGTLRSDPAARTGAAIPGPTAPLPDGVERYIYATRVTQSR